MRRFLGINNSKSVSRIIAFAVAVAGGTGLLYSNETISSESLFEPRADSLMLQYATFEDPSVLSFPHDKFHPCLSMMGFVSSNSSSKDSSGGSKSIADAAADVFPALVFISVPKKYGKDIHTHTGSGTIIDPDGTILTCAHLVSKRDGREVASNGKVNVTLRDGRSFVGTVLNIDLHHDVAIVKINTRTPLSVAKLGSSSKLRPGECVFALGSPHHLKNTVTAGIVSCVNRKSNDLGLGGMLREYIQTDCALNPGNSGGPLVNLDGEVIGVNVMSRSRTSGIHCAVPIDSVLKIMEHFKKNGTVIRLWLGMKMVDLDETMISQLKYKDPQFPKVTKGVLVVMVEPGSPADVAGICPGDVVVMFHKKPIRSIGQIITLMGDDVGKPFQIVVKRATETLGLTVVAEATTPEI